MSAPSFRHYLFQLLQLKQGGGNSTQLSHSWIPRVSLKKGEDSSSFRAEKELRKNRVKEEKKKVCSFFPKTFSWKKTTLASLSIIPLISYGWSKLDFPEMNDGGHHKSTTAPCHLDEKEKLWEFSGAGASFETCLFPSQHNHLQFHLSATTHYSKVSALPERYINSLSELYILDNELTDVMGMMSSLIIIRSR
ncbi:hypothetical protein CEXT_106551 [Caerostris extrusa]|uniref:Uncharacterized protein n=1 Tax=Caerostris extrusa TaxID=172846 RepID=A0AAV4QDD7_CAEEX|nr:hypothetical protein CEXT_106551 [Caerostris extrusa]